MCLFARQSIAAAREFETRLGRGHGRLLRPRGTGTDGGAGAGGPLGFAGGIVGAALELAVLSLAQHLRLSPARAGILPPPPPFAPVHHQPLSPLHPPPLRK